MVEKINIHNFSFVKISMVPSRGDVFPHWCIPGTPANQLPAVTRPAHTRQQNAKNLVGTPRTTTTTEMTPSPPPPPAQRQPSVSSLPPAIGWTYICYSKSADIGHSNPPPSACDRDRTPTQEKKYVKATTGRTSPPASENSFEKSNFGYCYCC